MSNAIRIPRPLELVAAIEAGFALSRFTHSDWLTGTILALVAGLFGAVSLLAERRKRTDRRY